MHHEAMVKLAAKSSKADIAVQLYTQCEVVQRFHRKLLLAKWIVDLINVICSSSEN